MSFYYTMSARMPIHVTNQLMDRIVEASRSNSNFGNREKKETKFIVGNLGKVALPSNRHFVNNKALLLKTPKC
jgi:hypothetical protein